MPLSDIAIRNAKPGNKPARLFDAGGLYLEVSPSGGKWWRLKYRFDGKEKRLSLGVYPDVSLKEARDRREEGRKLLAQGVDPGAVRKAAKASRAEQVANSFEAIAREWFMKNSPEWAVAHSEKIIARLERDVFPWLGGRPVGDITAREVLEVIRRIEARGALDTAHRAKGTISQVIRYAIATGRAERDPCPDLRGALPSKNKTKKNFPAITDPEKVGELLRALDAFRGTFVVWSALHLAPLLFVRPGELRKAEWAAIDLVKGEWNFQASKTKTDHTVPLAKQAVAILKDLYALTGRGRYVFPGRNVDTPMSEAAVNAAPITTQSHC